LGEGGQWVKGAKAGWKAGRKLESLPHIGHDTEGTEKTNHSAAEPQPNRCGGIKNPRARKRIYGLVVQRARRRQTTENTEDTEKNKPRRTRRTQKKQTTARHSRNQTMMAFPIS